jgi:small nuclear ribonucleoprotein (snRNP)-like protein
MTIKELIGQLQQLDQTLNVYVDYESEECNHCFQNIVKVEVKDFTNSQIWVDPEKKWVTLEIKE